MMQCARCARCAGGTVHVISGVSADVLAERVQLAHTLLFHGGAMSGYRSVR